MGKLTTFNNRQVTYIETMQVKDGVECDTYSFVGDDTQDLAIVRVTKGFKTPLQKILQGDKTVEGFMEGKGTLVVQLEDGTTNTYDMDATSASKEVEVKVGQIMQWTAPSDTDLVFYEICDPPYKDGRFENLPG
jgi:hypothetical protein